MGKAVTGKGEGEGGDQCFAS